MKRFGKYRLEERIAVGGTSEVFRAAVVWGDGSEERVVLKKILPQRARDSDFRTLFHEEALVLASLKHPNIVELRDFGEMQGTLFIALEYVDGADLDILLRKSSRAGAPIPPPAAARVVEQVCAALECIHTRTSSAGTPLRIVHRDISPHNILVSTRGEVKLADFGIAKSIIREAQTTEGTIKGKFDYLSPEQASPGEPVDPRTDLFAVGVVLYELLFGMPPFRGRSDVETLERVRECRYDLNEERLVDDDRVLARLAARCLQRDPKDRLADASALRGPLQEYLGALDGERERSADVSAWVQRVLAYRSGSMDQPMRDLFGRGRAGGTAVLAKRDDPPPAAEVSAELEAAPSQRFPALASLLAVAVVTAIATLALSRLLSSPPDSGPDSRTAPVAAASPDQIIPGPDAQLAAKPPEDVPDGARPDRSRVAPSEGPWLEVRSTPPGARVLVNGAPAGKTPAVLPAPTRRFRVKVIRPGYRTWSRRVAAPSEDLVLMAELRRAKPVSHGRLTINSIPWARVYLDGRLLGTTPIRNAKVVAGSHRVVLRDGNGRRLHSFVTNVVASHTRVHSFDRKGPRKSQ